MSIKPLRFSIVARVPIDGDRLEMANSYPAELPAMAGKGWPALIHDLRVTNLAGLDLKPALLGSAGWKLSRPVKAIATLRYLVDFAPFEKAGWSSPLESAVTDDEHVVASCRALFITTPAMEEADVQLRSPAGWLAVAPWPALNPGRHSFRAATTADLTENMAAFTSRPVDSVTASGFTLAITAMGHWAPLHSLLQETMHRIVSLEAGMMGSSGGGTYSVILVPTVDTGGEAYRQSFAYAFAEPTAENRGVWANTLAHELFHYWNGSRLQGEDYASSQWFQEGFTEYVANLTTLVGKIIGPEEFVAKLKSHIANYARLTTTLENIGTHKGPPLYSAGALVAFSFDAMIRHATGGRQTIGAFFRTLWRQTREGERKYGWPDIEGALRATAPGDWAGYYERHIRGSDKLPLAESLALAGLKLRDGTVEIDQSARPDARAVWNSMNARL
ncbi:hypothetical protein [Sphingomonas alba]|uniref:Peptidase M61 catalytic domain-containing protein n=1 Tax=Sphingomonas alba TaxID=2908208 RepID=A0ABT0RPR0_9SPHN|nr:hypothetical protein [Sphingomonas alba]MCL6684647.1 hypothetical protein [Sphingomonas alba]